MKPNRRVIVFIASFLLIFTVGITIQVVAQTIADLRATNTSRLVVDNNNNGLADGGDVIEYTIQVANCSPNTISGMTYQSDIDPNTSLIPNSIQVTLQGTGLCGGGTVVDNPPPTPLPPVNADAVDDAFTITNGATNTENILPNDTGEAPITVVSFGGPPVANVGDTPADGVTTYVAPSGIVYTLDSAGNLTIDATALTVGTSGTDTLFYQIQAGNATTDTAQITITYGDFPTAVDDTYSVAQSGVLNDDLAINDTLGTPAATVVSFGGGSLGGTSNTPNTIAPLPAYPDGSLTVNADGTFSFTAPATFTGTFTFDYTLDNGIGTSTATVTINAEIPPTVTSTTPTNSAVNVASNSDIIINFSELVDVAGDWVSIVCTVSGTFSPSNANLTITPASPATSFTITPTGGFDPAGESCTVTLTATLITDNDTNPPAETPAQDQLDGDNNGIGGDNYVFSFTTTDAAPTVTSTTPLTGATVADNQAVTINFSELVSLSNVPGAGITWVCGATSITYTTSATANITSITLTPTITMPQDSACTVTVNDVDVADDDLLDPPNTMTADYIFNFTVDGTITVTATTPPNGTNNVALNSDVTITFDEAPQLNGGWFTIACTTSNITTANSVVNVVGNVATINPNTDFLTAETCTVTVLSSATNGVTDADTLDAPDLLDGNNDGLTGDNYTFTFTTSDSLPELTLAEVEQAGFVNVTVTSTQIANNTDIRLTFDEPVTFAGGAYSVVCTTSGNVTASYTASATPASIVTLTYGGAGLADGEVCTVTLISTQITDTDGLPPAQLDGDGDNIQDGSPADDETFTFTVDNAPSVNSTNPADGAVNVSLSGNLVIDFSEPVNFSGASTTLDCGAGAIAYGITGDGTATITLDPTPATLPVNTPCVLTIAAGDVTDVDGGDPPNTMAASVVVNFTTVDDAPPTVITTSPTNGATGVATDTDISITFSENVDINIAGFSLNCGGAIGFNPALPTTATPNITFTPISVLPANTLCTVTLLAVSITDQDGPADQLDGDNNGVGGDNYVFTFTTDGAPTVINTVPNNGATGVANNANVVIDFNENVVADETSFAIVCGATPITINAGDVTGSGTATITINPTDPFVDGVSCTVTVFAAGITDVDAGDPPDNMVANYIFSFTTDAPPSVTSTAPLDSATNVNTTTNITVNFNENVNILAPITVDCGAGAISYTTTPPVLTNTPSVVINPDSDLPAGTTCTVTILQASVEDVDAFDPPNTMTADYIFSFTTDAAPTLTGVQAELSNTLTPIAPPTVLADVDDDTSIVLTFSEAVNNLGGVTVTCTTGVLLTTNGGGLNTAGNGTATLTITRTAGTYNGGDTCTISFTPAQITDVDVNDPPDELVPPVPATYQFTVRATANDDSYTVTPHLTFTSPTGVRNNDNPTTATINTFGASLPTGTIPNGTTVGVSNFITITGAGRVYMNPDGTFVFYPDAGVSTGTFSFFYTIAGGDSAEVELTFDGQELVWFVDNAPTSPVCTGTNVGTQACPSADLATVSVVDTNDDTIFIADGNYTCPITLQAGENIVGDGSSSSIATVSGVTPAAGSAFPALSGADPILSGTASDCITLATNNSLYGFTIGNTGNFVGVNGNNFGLLTVEDMTINGTGQTVLLNTGTLDVTFDSLTSTSCDGSSSGIQIQNVTAGTFDVTGGTSISNCAVNGIFLQNNTLTANLGNLTLTNNVLYGLNSANGGTIVANTTTISGSADSGIAIQNHPATKPVTFGVTTVTQNSPGNAVGLAGSGSNQAAAITFNSLDVTNNAGNAFRIINQTGTVTVTNATGSNITSVGGVALNVQNPLGGTTPLALNLTNINASGGASGVVISNASGTVSASGGALSGSGNVLDIQNATVDFSYGGTISHSNTSHAVFVDNLTTPGGNINLTGTITATNLSSGINIINSEGNVTLTTVNLGTSVARLTNTPITLTNNTGTVNLGTVNAFTNGVTAMNATDNDGTINSTAGTINATNGRAINIDGPVGLTTLGMTLTSVSSSGTATGMVIQDTDGTFTVAGDGGVVNNGSGGTIQNTTADAVQLNNTNGLISLNYMIIQDIGTMTGAMNTRSGHDAIQGLTVNGGLSLNRTIIRRISDQAIHGGIYGMSVDTFTVWNGLTITNSTIENTNRYHVANIGDANNEGMIRILGIRGTVNITNSTLQDGAEMLDFFVNDGTLNLTVINSDFNRSYKEFTVGALASVGNHCIDVVVQEAGSANVVVGSRNVVADGNVFLNCRIGSIRVVNDTGSTGNSTFIAGNNSFVSNDHSSGIGGDFDFPQGGVLAQTLGTGTMDVIIEDNTFDEITNASGGVGQLSLAIDNGTMQARVLNNTFDTPGNAPWWVVARGGDGTVEFVNNTVIQGFFACPDPACEDFIPPAGGYNGPGLRTLFDAQNGSVLNVTMTNNTLAEHDTGFDPGQTVEFRALNSGPAPTMCVSLTNNRAPDGYSLEQFAGTFNLDNGVNAFTGVCTVGQCQTVLQANGNTGGTNNPLTTPPVVNLVGNINVVNLVCPTPTGSIFP